ncbi:hypothetical protein [Pseudanabaena sp. BC1403]|uniref:hypothetical protein n=1 Tax=Pseudanabaena sp. BC1403 TaxID=2043171 RepID=UPI000CD90E5E|nr:hypothetical protein [Pseudanabaena sp. BC1403]
MEPIAAVVIGILTIIGSGSLAKVGENITDGTGNLAKSLWAMLKRKAPNTQTVKLLAAGKEVDIQQAVIDLEPITNDPDDPEMIKLLEEVRSLLASNKELAAKVESATRINIEKQVNVDQSGTNNTQNNTFNL